MNDDKYNFIVNLDPVFAFELLFWYIHTGNYGLYTDTFNCGKNNQSKNYYLISVITIKSNFPQVSMGKISKGFLESNN